MLPKSAIIFLRVSFFPLYHRRDLPKVPAYTAYTACNGAKSRLETYLTAVLPIAGRNNAASDITSNDVPRRLARNAKLNAELTSGQNIALVSTGGKAPTPEMVLPLRGRDFIELHHYLTRALASYHFDTIIPSDYHVGAGLLTQVGERCALGLFGARARARVRKATRGRVFEYEGAQAVDDPALTIWCFKAYGGLRLPVMRQPLVR